MRYPGWVIAGLVLASLSAVRGQSSSEAFEVASIRPDRSEDRGSSSQNTSPGGRFVAINVSPMQLLIRAFGVVAAQIEGPEWLDADGYDVTAKADTPKELSPAELRPVLRKLLEERFALKYHRETKTLSAYSLTVAKTGMKMAEHTGADGPSTQFRNQSGKLILSARKQSRRISLSFSASAWTAPFSIIPDSPASTISRSSGLRMRPRTHPSHPSLPPCMNNSA
jgi:uncharacterized protein (TIGR03435 family)